MAGTTPVRGDAAAAPGDPSPLVTIRGAVRHYGAVHAVDGVDLDIARGELFGLIGHNGAGKSTLFRMMLGLVGLTAGDISIDGVPVTGRHFRDVRRRIGYLPENVVLYDNLTGLETLHFFAKLKDAPRDECAGILQRVGLGHAADRRVAGYSKGMRQRLGFAQALLGRPQILFLDEPTTGLDPEAIRNFYAILRELKTEGVTIILTSHILAEIQQRVDRLAIMVAGKVRATGSVQSLREQVDLPLTLTLSVREGSQAMVCTLIGELPVSGVRDDGERVVLQCRREAKMAVLEALAACRADVLDIHVREPSLEDVFFGFSD